MRKFPLNIFLALTLGLVSLISMTALSWAQPDPGSRGYGWGPGAMMGPGMMGRGACDPGVAGLAAWRIERIERAIKPTDAQKAALNELKAASAKAAETISAACPRQFPANASQRFDLMEKRLEAMLQAIKTVRPAFDAFYGALSNEQKTLLDSIGPRQRGWQHWRWREER